ncbi:universal stress protein [Amycolatopsis anabasis]|uniref:universal stress protein n=1 Tax=Amycolatopsis anabasis TaxID=1840409 RepID=UPI001FE88C89|nr:universal stress protein [Amycolatopsis anabasis]
MIGKRVDQIVVGIDGSSSAVDAALWAAAEAERHRAGLRLVHAFVVPRQIYPEFVVLESEVRSGMKAQGEQWLRAAVDAVAEAQPEVRVETELAEGDAIRILLRESVKARLMVLGSRGLGGFTGMLIGSTAVALAAHGKCPTVVVRGQAAVSGPVLVGCDGSPASEAAVAMAFEEASVRGAPLVAVHAWTDPVAEGAWRLYPLSISPSELEEDERRALSEQLAGWQEKYPDVKVQRIVAQGRAVRTLLKFAADAQLIVVGSRGRGGFAGMVLGSVSQALVYHAPCPVVVTRPSNAS